LPLLAGLLIAASGFINGNAIDINLKSLAMENGVLLENLSSQALKELLKEVVIEVLTSMPSKQEDRFLTRKEVCKKFHISLPTIDLRLRDGSVKGYKVGNRVLIKESEIDLEPYPRRYKNSPVVQKR
jgi:excisionase family DNA binding protein